MIITVKLINCLESISEKFGYAEPQEVSFKGSVYDSLIDYDAIDKSKTFNMHKYLMVKNNTKEVTTNMTGPL